MNLRIEQLECRNLLTAKLVADINQFSSNSSNPRDFIQLEDTTFFIANSNLGAELWKTDGTAEGTTIVRDIVPGSDGANPYELIPFGDVLLFHSNDQVWRTDGTVQGTFQLDGMTRIVAANSTKAISENGLMTDGTNEGTFELDDYSDVPIQRKGAVTEEFFYIQFRNGRYHRVDLAGIGERLLSVGRSEVFLLGDNLFMARASNGQTTMAAVPEDPESSPEDFVINGELLDPEAVLDANGVGYFETVDESGNTSLWRTDGTELGTMVVAEFVGDDAAPFGLAPSVLDSVVVGNTPGEIWFVASDQNGEEVWRSDGTLEGTGIVRDVFRGRLGSAPTNLTVDDGSLWFVANDGITGPQIWKTDGTHDGTQRVTQTPQPLFEFSEGPTILGVSSAGVYFRTPSDDGTELWVTDGAPTSTRQLKDIMPGAAGSFPADFVVNEDGSALFAATNDAGRELWTTDGTEDGTSLLKDIYDSGDTKSSNPNNFVEFDNKLYFVANDGIHGAELWSYDGTTTSLVADIWTGPKSSSPKELTVLGDSLFFAAENEDSGRELFRLNRFGVSLVHDIAPSGAGSNPEQLFDLEGQLYFVADINEDRGERPTLDLAARRGLWSTNGSELRLEVETAEGDTRRAAGAVFNVTKFDGSLYFYELNESLRNDVLVHRLTPTADGAVDEIINETSARDIRGNYNIQANDEFLIFIGHVEEAARDSGFLVVKPGADAVAIDWQDFLFESDLVAVGNEFLLTGRRTYLFNGETDGTFPITSNLPIVDSLTISDTTFMVRTTDVSAQLLTGSLRENRLTTVARFQTNGINSALPTELIDWNDTLYFVANDFRSGLGAQVWSVNEEQDGVIMETALGPERIGSDPSSLFVFNGELYFSADDGVAGREIWKLEAPTELGDVNDDGVIEPADIDALFAATQSGESNPDFDLDDDSDVDLDDVTYLVENVLQTRFGDTNLDGDVDFSDFLRLADAFRTQGESWANGDLTGDREVTFDDYLILAENYV